MRQRIRRTACSLILWVLGLPVVSASPAVAAGVVGTGSPGTCTEAALDAALAGGGSVTFNCGTQPFTIAVTTPKIITADTSIDGGGLLALSGGGSVQIFHISPGETLNLSNAALRLGTHPDQGGAIFNEGGTLTVTNCTFSQNRVAIGVSGGVTIVRNSIFSRNTGHRASAIDALGGDLTVEGSTFSHNFRAPTKMDCGTAISAIGVTMTVTDSTFTANGGGGCAGGAIAQYGASTLTVTRSTFARNKSCRSPHGCVGGAICNGDGGAAPTLIVANSTFFGNHAYAQGGAISNLGNLTVTNSTFVRNAANGGGGGIFSGDGTVTLQNTLLAKNSGGNCSGPMTDGGHNLRWPPADGSCVGSTDDPKLARRLQSNGGPTQTIALQSGSAAINAGDNAICAASPVNGLDQRGFARPGPGSTNCSIGAYEFNAVPAP